jgi:hypothetical protein
MTRVGRAIEKGETNGLMKIVVDAHSKQLVAVKDASDSLEAPEQQRRVTSVAERDLL